MVIDQVLVLYTEFMPYNLAAFNSLSWITGATVHVVYWDFRKVSPYVPKEVAGIKFIPRSASNHKSLKQLIDLIDPDFIFVSGWRDKLYLRLALTDRLSGIPVIVGMDNKWERSFRQILFSIAAKVLHRFFFSGAFVPGKSQYQFARKLGFTPSQIRTGAYTADTACFWQERKVPFRKEILFIGRLTPIKGIDSLVTCFLKLSEEVKFTDWKLIVVGTGPMQDSLPISPRIQYKGFLNQQEIALLAQEVSFFCLPSLAEPWGLVVHEMAAAGVPLLLSSACGSAEDFLVDGYNGYYINPKDEQGLSSGLGKMMELSNEELVNMGERSRELSTKNSPAIWSHSLMSLAGFKDI